MKRSWLYIIGAVLVIAAAAAIIAAMENSKDHSEKIQPAATNNTSKAALKPKQACAIFTLAEAKQVLGDSAKGGEGNNSTSSDDLAVSTCSYTQDSGSSAPVSVTKSASLLVRAPKTAAGTTSNHNQFGHLKPADVQLVAGYGDSAYWDVQYGQLNILKNNTWYILSNGPITPSDRTLNQAEQLADVLISKL